MRLAPRPGDPVPPERELAGLLSLSRKTVRDELSRLEAEGIIRKAGRRARVVQGGLQPCSATTSLRPRDRDNMLISLVFGTAPHPAAHTQPGWSYYVSSGASFELGERDADTFSIRADRFMGSDKIEVSRLVAGRGLLLTCLDHFTPAVMHSLSLSAPCVTWHYQVEGDGTHSMDRVLPDHKRGAALLVEALIRSGRRRILQIAPRSAGIDWWPSRRAGYESAMAEAGLQPLPPLHVSPPPALNAAVGDSIRFEGIVRHYAGYLVEHLASPNRVDAIMATSDAGVPVIARACELYGLQAGSDVILAGYDNFIEGHWAFNEYPVRPSFTIDKQNFEIGRAMVRMLFDRLEARLEIAPQTAWVEPRLVDSHSHQNGSDKTLVLGHEAEEREHA